MSRKRKSGLYDFLNAIGVLDNGTPEEIAAAKKAYMTERKRKWRQNNRRENKEYVITLSPSEVTLLRDIAKKHRRSISAYLKAAAIAYARQVFLVPDVLAVNAIRELLTMNYALLKKCYSEGLVPYQIGKELTVAFEALEGQVLRELRSPLPLEQHVVKAVRHDPAYLDVLSRALKNP